MHNKLAVILLSFELRVRLLAREHLLILFVFFFFFVAVAVVIVIAGVPLLTFSVIIIQ